MPKPVFIRTRRATRRPMCGGQSSDYTHVRNSLTPKCHQTSIQKSFAKVMLPTLRKCGLRGGAAKEFLDSRNRRCKGSRSPQIVSAPSCGPPNKSGRRPFDFNFAMDGETKYMPSKPLSTPWTPFHFQSTFTSRKLAVKRGDGLGSRPKGRRVLVGWESVTKNLWRVIKVGRLDRVRRMQKSSKNEKGFLFEKAAACNSLERLMPRDGIEPPTPAFSGPRSTI